MLIPASFSIIISVEKRLLRVVPGAPWAVSAPYLDDGGCAGVCIHTGDAVY